jgi:predicted DNA-binding transcriptional regulator AlpA
MGPEFISDKDVANRYGVSRTTVWRWASSGDFPQPRKLSPGCSRWAVHEIELWERNHCRPASATHYRSHK